MKEFTRHPDCALFAQFDMTEAELTELATDIKEHGLKQPIIVHNGQIIDGWNRYLACQQAGVKPIWIDYDGLYEVWTYVKAVNLMRRHMTPEQRALIVLLKEQQTRGVPRGTPPSVREIAKEHNLPHGVAHRVQAVVKDAVPEVINAVIEGKTTITQAAKAAKLPKEQQVKEIQKPKKPRQPRKPAPSLAQPDSDRGPTVPTSEADQLLAEVADDFDPFVVIDEQLHEIETLQSQVAALAVTDDKKEIQRLFELTQVLQARLDDEMAKNARLYQERETMGRQIQKLCKELGIDDDRKLLARIRELKEAGEL